MTRILYRLRFASEQRPLDEVSMAYVLPLIFAVLNRNGIEEEKGEEEGEQVLLALEFLSFHSGSCKFIYEPDSGIELTHNSLRHPSSQSRSDAAASLVHAAIFSAL